MRISRTKLRQLVLEEIQLLTEITFASAVNNLGSKKNKKMIRRWVESGTGRAPRPVDVDRGDPLYKYQVTLAGPPYGGGPSLMPDEAREMLPYLKGGVGPSRDGGHRPLTKREIWDAYPPEIQDQLIDKYVAYFKSWLLDLVPDDLEDNQKGLVVTWLNRLSRDPESGYLNRFLSGDTPGADAWGDFEMFFHYQQFMEEKDLNRIADLDHLEQTVLDARDDIKVYQEKRSYADAGEGTEVLRDDDEFYIAAIHNKGAACSLGKGTDWCTAAPGLDYFSEYYRPQDPLFYFYRYEDLDDSDQDRGQRFQFHYGSLQFMDVNDENLDDDVMADLHRHLMQTEAPHKYTIVKEYDRKMKIRREDTSAEELHGLIEDDNSHYEELVDIAMHDNVSEDSLRKLMAVGDPRTADYVGRTGDQVYGTALKSAVARVAKTPELLDDLWEATKAGVEAAQEETEKRLRASSYEIEEPGWADERLPMQLKAVRGHFASVWRSIAFNANVSNDLLKEIAEYDGGGYLKTFSAEKILAREEGFIGKKELRPIQIRGRVVRRQQAERGDPVSPVGWEERERGRIGGDLSESKIYARWKKIIN